ncbi:hypothetical protein [Natronomonas sp.]|jgi:hypothetical protein|uniref:hypothetical protein n=1 Tax=Natronomonas sp. TaxID=2184060 RepID=UPI002FC3D111
MSLLLDAARLSVVVNVGLLAALGYVWLSNYRRHGATHTLVLLGVAGLLFVQNVVWLYLYAVDVRYIEWYLRTPVDLQAGLTALCVLETVALVILTRITYR